MSGRWIGGEIRIHAHPTCGGGEEVKNAYDVGGIFGNLGRFGFI